MAEKHSNNEIIIRDARPEEADGVAKLLKGAFEQYKENIPPEGWKYYLDDICDVRGRLEEAELIVAEIQGKLAGTVTLYLNSDGNYWPKGWGVIRLLGVSPAYRDRGIGRALMEDCIRRCREQGIKTIGLYTTGFMAIAKDMYEKMGFKHIPERDFRPAPEANLVLAYRLDLV